MIIIESDEADTDTSHPETIFRVFFVSHGVIQYKAKLLVFCNIT